jgi:glycosyltransferase involved in cell wall biosynthesis
MCKNILFLATVDSHIYYFHIPFMKLLKEMGYCVEVAASNVGFTGRIEKEGFKVYNIPFSRNPISFSNIKTFFILLRLIREKRYIMLHAHTPVASFVGRIAAKLAGVPHIVYTAHGFHFHEYGSKLRNFVYYGLEKFVGKFTDVLITINKDDFQIAKEKKVVPKGKVVYIKGVGVNMNEMNPKIVEEHIKEKLMERFYITEGTSVITSIGRLEREKHFDELIKALGIIKKKRAKFRLFIAGDGLLKSNLIRFSKSLEVGREVVFLGYTENVLGLLSVTDIYVTTSSREGLPVSVMEAMAMERPIVAYNIRGVRDLVEDGINGFLVPFGDVKALSEKIKYLLEHPDIAEEMGKRSRERIEKEFSLDVVLHQMEVLYKEILESEHS